MRTRFARLLLGLRSGHDVVMGWGPASVVYSSVRNGRKVTHVAPDAGTSTGRYAFIERSGSIIDQLKAAAAGRARRILVDEGDDAMTWAVAQAAARTCHKADVLAFIADPWLLERLDRADAAASLNAFSYAGGVARQVMLAHPPYLLARKLNARAQHIVIVGFGAVGQSLAREFLVTSVSTSPEPMMITVIDPGMERLEQDFIARHPELRSHVDIGFLKGDLRQSDETLTNALQDRLARAEPCAVYVAINDASLPLSMGVAIRDRAMREELFRAPIFLCAPQGAGLPHVRHGAGLVGEPHQTLDEWNALQDRSRTNSLLCDLCLVTFGSWVDALDGSGLMEPQLDGQACAYHEGYLALTQNAASTEPPRPSGRPWKNLPDEYRVSNRRAASHIRAKLDAAGFAALDAWLAGPEDGRLSHELPHEPDMLMGLSESDMNRLGELEHTRWLLERVLNGWRYAPVRDDVRRTHPDIKPNSQLDEATKEKDRNNIRQTAKILHDMMSDQRRRTRRR